MATKVNMYGKVDKKNDGELQGEEQLFVDPRDQYDIMEKDWHRYAFISPHPGPEPCIPVEVVKQVMTENEQLRESLYAQQNSEYYRNMLELMQTQGHSTSEVIKLVRQIYNALRQALSEQEIFRLIYTLIVDSVYNLGFANKPKNMSKLQLCFKNGSLPIISMYADILWKFCKALAVIDYMGTQKFFVELAAKRTKMNVKKP